MEQTVEQVVRRELGEVIPCPEWHDCKSGRGMSGEKCSDTCSIYGCNVQSDHSALNRIYHQLGVNGNLQERHRVNQVVREEVVAGRFKYRE